jgi:hypothetical protein
MAQDEINKSTNIFKKTGIGMAQKVSLMLEHKIFHQGPVL